MKMRRKLVRVRGICPGCFRDKLLYHRGICWGCYFTPEVRARFPITSKYGRLGIGHNNSVGDGSKWEPTAAPPRSEEKIRVMGQRVLGKHPLCHPGDNPIAEEKVHAAGAEWGLRRLARRILKCHIEVGDDSVPW